MTELSPAASVFWQTYLQETGLQGASTARVSAGMPGNKEIADTLVALYLDGKKTAGSGLVKDYELAGDPLPQAGDHWIVLDSLERPRCVAKTVRTEIHPFKDVTEDIARAEGEGDLSLAYWRRAHEKFFSSYLPTLGIDDLEEALVVTEFFEIVIPLSASAYN